MAEIVSKRTPIYHSIEFNPKTCCEVRTVWVFFHTFILGPRLPPLTAPHFFPQPFNAVLCRTHLQHAGALVITVLAGVIVSMIRRIIAMSLFKLSLSAPGRVTVEMSLVKRDEHSDVVVDGFDPGARPYGSHFLGGTSSTRCKEKVGERLDYVSPQKIEPG